MHPSSVLVTRWWYGLMLERRGRRPALSLGERVSGDGVFSSRRRTGEGLLAVARCLCGLQIRITHLFPPTQELSEHDCWPRDPSPVALRLVAASERDTLSPRERADHSRRPRSVHPKLWDMLNSQAPALPGRLTSTLRRAVPPPTLLHIKGRRLPGRLPLHIKGSLPRRLPSLVRKG